MCGICGIYAYRSDATGLRDAGAAMRDAMAARGPDGSGEWARCDGKVWLGHRRLAIIDLTEAGAQPMASADGKLILSFNGEIYNYRELRSELEAKGARFHGSSDSEVLIEGYRCFGPGFVQRLRGMFAFAIWDEQKRRLFAARDPYGIKPFYYCDAGGRFSFASQVKALLRSPFAPRDPDPAGTVGFLVFGSVPEPWTTYRHIKALPAGTTLLVSDDGVAPPQRYHSVPGVIREGEIAASGRTWSAAAQEEVEAALRESARYHMVADVPVGAFLSAGVDSGALVGLMRDVSDAPLHTVTLSYDEFAGKEQDEAPLAAETARHYATRHFNRRVSGSEFDADLPRIMAAMDQPSVDGINTWFVSKAAHEFGLKVAISGVGGDELFRGYSTFRQVPRLTNWFRHLPRSRWLGERASSLVALARRKGFDVHPKWGGVVSLAPTLPGAYLLQRALLLPHELSPLALDRDFVEAGLAELRPLEHAASIVGDGPRSASGQVSALESCLYLRNQLLRDTDWAGMAHSLEIRTPMVDHVLLRRVAPMVALAGAPSGKVLLSKAPSRPLPEVIVSRRKTGFTIPVADWIASRSGVPADRLFSRRWALEVAANLGAHACVRGFSAP